MNGRILITGAAGFLGHHLTHALRSRGYTVIPVDDLRVPPLLEHPPGLVVMDVAALTSSHLDGIDGIFHLAALRSVPDSMHFPQQYAQNVAASVSLFDAVRRCRVPRVLFASSCEVYGIAPKIPTPEHAPLAPRSPYAMSKAAIELYAGITAWYGETDLRIARLFNVYGPGNRPDTVISSLCRSIVTDRRLRVDGPGTQRRDFSYVDTTVARLVRMFELPSCPPVLNIGSGRSTSVLELVDHLRQRCPDAEVNHAPERAGEIPEFRADTTLSECVLGAVTEVPIDVGITRTLAWWQRFLADGSSCIS